MEEWSCKSLGGGSYTPGCPGSPWLSPPHTSSPPANFSSCLSPALSSLPCVLLSFRKGIGLWPLTLLSTSPPTFAADTPKPRNSEHGGPLSCSPGHRPAPYPLPPPPHPPPGEAVLRAPQEWDTLSGTGCPGGQRADRVGGKLCPRRPANGSEGKLHFLLGPWEACVSQRPAGSFLELQRDEKAGKGGGRQGEEEGRAKGREAVGDGRESQRQKVAEERGSDAQKKKQEKSARETGEGEQVRPPRDKMVSARVRERGPDKPPGIPGPRRPFLGFLCVWGGKAV